MALFFDLGTGIFSHTHKSLPFLMVLFVNTIFIFIIPLLHMHIGQRMGGQGQFKEIFSITLWSGYMNSIFHIILYMIVIFLFPDRYFVEITSSIVFGTLILLILLYLFGFEVFFLSEVHNFSKIKGTITIILSLLIVAVMYITVVTIDIYIKSPVTIKMLIQKYTGS